MSAKHPPKSAKRASKAKPAKKPAPVQEVRIETLIAGFVPVETLARYYTFAEHFLATGDGMGAMMLAKLCDEGANEQSRRRTYGNLMLQPALREILTNQYKAIIAKTGATVERVWQEITYAAFLDPAVFYDEAGDVKPMPDIPEEARRAITGMKVKSGTIGEDGEFTERELKYAGKDAALEKLMRLHRMVDNDRTLVVTADDWARAVQEGHDRAAAARGSKPGAADAGDR